MGMTCSDGSAVELYISPRSSEAGLGLVTRLTTIVTRTHTSQDQMNLYRFSAIAFASAEKARIANAWGVNFHQQPEQDRRCRSGDQSPESSGGSGAPPQHPDDHRAEQGNDEEAKQCLDVIHDAGESSRSEERRG